MGPVLSILAVFILYHSVWLSKRPVDGQEQTTRKVVFGKSARVRF